MFNTLAIIHHNQITQSIRALKVRKKTQKEGEKEKEKEK